MSNSDLTQLTTWGADKRLAHQGQLQNETGPLACPPRVSQPRILLVDDARANRRVLSSILSGSDFTIVEASSTSEALATIASQQIDLVLVDELAPEIGGPEFCKIVRRAAPTRFLPVFVVASQDDVESEVASINAGADEFIVRPLRPRAVQARVRASLEHRALIDSLDESEAVLFSLAQSVEERDPELGTHCQRLAMMTTAMGVVLGLPPEDILSLQRAGYLHDIGKIAIPDKILFKPGPLTADEWIVMKSHAERGERICSRMSSLKSILPIIRNHHERWDGSGYPDRLRGEEIPLLARVLQIADIYDALTTERTYKSAFTSEQAIEILQDEAAKGWRDPRLVSMFGDILPMFRTQGGTEITNTESMRALAASIDNHRKTALRANYLSPFSSFPPIGLVSGL